MNQRFSLFSSVRTRGKVLEREEEVGEKKFPFLLLSFSRGREVSFSRPFWEGEYPEQNGFFAVSPRLSNLRKKEEMILFSLFETEEVSF